MFALSDPIRRDSREMGKKKQAKVKVIKRHLINVWLPSKKGWCDCYSTGISVCHPVISTGVAVPGARTEVIRVFSEKDGCSLFP